jgi:hypothetical protein
MTAFAIGGVVALTFDEVVDRLEYLGLRVRGSVAQCPAHDDRTPSLSLREGEDRVLLYCHAGCTYAEIMKALDDAAEVPSFQADPARVREAKARKPYIVEHHGDPYLYEAVDGTPLMKQRVRQIDPDTGVVSRAFLWSSRTTGGGWSPGTAGHVAMLYRPPAVAGVALVAPEMTHITEGESDANALAAAGRTAVCAPNGSSGWRPEWTQELHDVPAVVVFADSDAPGLKHAREVARCLSADREGRLVPIYLAAQGCNDVRAHLDAGHDFAELRLLHIEAPTTPASEVGSSPVEASRAALVLEIDRQRVVRDAKRFLANEELANQASTGARLVDGATFVLDAPQDVPAVWGEGTDVLWAKGEALIIAGAPARRIVPAALPIAPWATAVVEPPSSRPSDATLKQLSTTSAPTPFGRTCTPSSSAASTGATRPAAHPQRRRLTRQAQETEDMAAIASLDAATSTADRLSLVVIAHDRPYDALLLRRTGADWPEVATTVGYADGRVAHLAVNAYLQKVALEQAPEHRRAALELEVARLDALQAAHWEAATAAGDLKAAHLVVKIIMQRSALLGLDHAADAAKNPIHTIVIGGTSEDYIAGLEAISRDDR